MKSYYRRLRWVAAFMLGAASPRAFSADGGFYASAAYGEANFTFDGSGYNQINYQVTTETSDSSWAVGVGYRVSPYFAVEVDYLDLGGPFLHRTGTTTQPSISVTQTHEFKNEMTGYLLEGIGALPIGNFELSAKLGHYFSDSVYHYHSYGTFTLTGSPPQNFEAAIDDKSAIDAWTVAVGAGYTIGDHVHVRVDWMTLLDVVHDTVGGKSDARLWMVGAQYRF